jgi:nicotinamide mononucleotide transporter
MSLIEIGAVVFSFLSVIMAVKRSLSTWIFGILGIVFYGILFFQREIFSNMLLQMIFLVQSFVGLYEWKTNRNQGELIVTKMSMKEWVSYLATLNILIIVMCLMFEKLDAITTSVSLMANVLLMNRKLENWFFWIIADVVYIIMFIEQKLYLSSGLYFVFLITCILGYFKWKNKFNDKNLS